MMTITGTISRAGRISVDGIPLTGIFIECSGRDIVDISHAGLYNKRVTVRQDRRTPERVRGPAFKRLPVENIGPFKDGKKWKHIHTVQNCGMWLWCLPMILEA
jgi:hypothetical protein